jgi:hypothetical protein
MLTPGVSVGLAIPDFGDGMGVEIAEDGLAVEVGAA